MGENREYITHNEELGCIHISEDVLAAVSAGAAAEVDGISGMMNVAAKKTAAKAAKEPAKKAPAKKAPAKKTAE